MIWSLRSRFDLGSKRAVLVTGEAVLVFHWQRGNVNASFAFDTDDSGLAYFDRYLRESPSMPTYMLVDLVEEEYRNETIPHVHGADRQALIARKQAWLFRGARYCNVLLQGREPGGRRDDRLLFSAIMSPQVMTPWIQLCTKHKVPLVGIYSLPILSRQLFSRLGMKPQNALLVTMQSCSGLRQTYFHDGALRLSRLAKMPRLGTVPFAPYVLGELEKTQRYLSSLRLPGGERLEIFVLTHGDLLDDLDRECNDTDNVRYRLIDVSEAARHLGVHGVLTTPFSDYLYAHVLLDAPPKNHYATRSERMYSILYNVQRLLWGSSLAVVLGSGLIATLNLARGVMLKQDAQERLEMAAFYESRWKQARQGLPATAVEPAAIKSAVSIVDSLRQRKAQPFAAFIEISHALEGFPDLALQDIIWEASAATAPTAAVTGSAPMGPSRRQAATIHGHVENFSGDFRDAIAMVNRFADALRGRPTVRDVAIERLPLDVSSKSTLEGDSKKSTEADDVAFELRVILDADHETG